MRARSRVAYVALIATRLVALTFIGLSALPHYRITAFLAQSGHGLIPYLVQHSTLRRCSRRYGAVPLKVLIFHGVPGGRAQP